MTRFHLAISSDVGGKPRNALELNTIAGARPLGIADKVGSLKTGKRTDLVVINTRALNMAVCISMSANLPDVRIASAERAALGVKGGHRFNRRMT
jgi:imidazolonepropionase-like amidohydrolase